MNRPETNLTIQIAAQHGRDLKHLKPATRLHNTTPASTNMVETLIEQGHSRNRPYLVPRPAATMNPTSPLGREWFREIPLPTLFFPFGEGCITAPS